VAQGGDWFGYNVAVRYFTQDDSIRGTLIISWNDRSRDDL
jgi:hypothetical protein